MIIGFAVAALGFGAAYAADKMGFDFDKFMDGNLLGDSSSEYNKPEKSPTEYKINSNNFIHNDLFQNNMDSDIKKILGLDEMFPKYFKRARPDRVRKLYNGKIKTYYYQYYGEKPQT